MPNFAQLSLRNAIAALLLICCAAGLAFVTTPRLSAAMGTAPSLDATVPLAFGEWKVVRDSYVQVDVSQGIETAQEQPYDQTVLRTYANDQGEQVMVALAWGERQRQDIKVHRPEVCYPAQGYVVKSLASGPSLVLPGAAAPVPTVELLAQGHGSMEAVRYWIRIGTNYGGDGLMARWYILKEGLAGRIPDGILVRASQRIRSSEEVAAAQLRIAAFLSEMTAAVPAQTRAMLIR